MPTFIESVLTYTKDSESPRKYYYWAALAAIAAVMRDNVFLDKFYYKLQPNIYVLLVGRSGLRKGPPVSLARSLVREVNNTKLFSGRVSIQGVISELAKARTQENGGPPLMGASGFLVASEFASFIIQDPAALTILTDLYDGHYNPEWSYMLRNSPTELLKSPCLTMLGASNETHMRDAVPNNAIGGGFVARTFIIYSNKKSGINPLTEKPETIFPLSHLVEQLVEISKCRGAFTWSAGGKTIYDKWYRAYQETEQSEEDTTGTMERLHDHILKAAMLISLSRKRDMRLEDADIQEAIIACQDFVPGAKRVSMGQGASVSAGGTAVLLRDLLTVEGNKLSRTQALQRHWAHFDSFELDRIVESLYAQKAIDIKIVKDIAGKSEPHYILNPLVLERYRQREEGKN